LLKANLTQLQLVRVALLQPILMLKTQHVSILLERLRLLKAALVGLVRVAALMAQTVDRAAVAVTTTQQLVGLAVLARKVMMAATRLQTQTVALAVVAVSRRLVKMAKALRRPLLVVTAVKAGQSTQTLKRLPHFLG
jgi:hypothetical protein